MYTAKKSRIKVIVIIIAPLFHVLYDIIGLYKLGLAIYIILGWLEAFDVVNKYNKVIYSVHNFLQSIIEPALDPIRRIIPTVGGWDLSPMALFFIIYFFQGILLEILKKFPS
ncbi:MAG: YggT family protein [Pseudomonadota bacterium]|jgi:YggT family protein|nr:YggT family protein [Alphaproteobacteria bacterium]